MPDDDNNGWLFEDDEDLDAQVGRPDRQWVRRVDGGLFGARGAGHLDVLLAVQLPDDDRGGVARISRTTTGS